MRGHILLDREYFILNEIDPGKKACGPETGQFHEN
jgi:hypothetical protein